MQVKRMVEGFSITGSKWVEKLGRYLFVCSDLSTYFRGVFKRSENLWSFPHILPRSIKLVLWLLSKFDTTQ